MLLGLGVFSVVIQSAQAQELRVWAAMSLKDVLTPIARAYEQGHPGVLVRLNFAATSTLVRQAVAGAPCDVFFSADQRNMERLVRAGIVAPGAPVTVLGNELVVVTRRSSDVGIFDVSALTAPSVRRIALCDPAVPVGNYAHAYLARRGVLEKLRGKILKVDHARAALAAVESMSADAGVVYRTDAMASKDCRIAFAPPASEQPDIRYMAAATQATRSRHASGFLQFARGAWAATFFEKAGFVPAWKMPESGMVPANSPATVLTVARAADIIRRTLLVGLVATLLAIPPGLALAYLLARVRFAGRALLQALVTLPMVLPPVAVGLLLLKLLSPYQPWADALYALTGGNPLFTWHAAAIAAFVMGMPLLVRTTEAAFAAVPRRLELLAASLGASRRRVFFTVTLPLAARGAAYGVLLCFLRALGEFGATTIVAGNIEGRTETLALAIYSRVDAQHDRDAMILALLSIAIAVAATVAGEVFLRRPAPADGVRGLQAHR